MAVKETAKKEHDLISKALILWGLSTAIQGVLIAYTAAMNISAGLAAGQITLTSIIAFPYELNAIGGIINLLFGVALVALGKKVKEW